MKLAGNTFLVTGGCSGLGEACVRRFIEQGANVIAADINAAAGGTLTDDLGSNVLFVPTDVTSTEQVEAAVAAAQQHFGGLQGVVNCAGILGASRVVCRDGPHDLELFKRVIEINLIGTFNVLRLAAQAMSTSEPNEHGERGVIVNTASVSAFEGQLGQAAYAASKGGVASMTLPIARELAKFGIRVVSIAPGVFNTSMIAKAPEAVQASLDAQTVFPTRLGDPVEYATFAQHIIENSMLNGSVLRLDGAMRLQAK
ncbi:MAG TPA: SDR family NAD(P)-dependent oxidoreductase [Pirellulaceae bacterium]|nr:SDR family NAD(P)-dependent oxidoreductase [Pirellulaceae bacterium]